MGWYGSGRARISGSAKNLGYAVQWFAMALAVLIIYLVLSVKRERVLKKNRRTLILIVGRCCARPLSPRMRSFSRTFGRPPLTMANCLRLSPWRERA